MVYFSGPSFRKLMLKLHISISHELILRLSQREGKLFQAVKWQMPIEKFMAVQRNLWIALHWASHQQGNRRWRDVGVTRTKVVLCQCLPQRAEITGTLSAFQQDLSKVTGHMVGLLALWLCPTYKKWQQSSQHYSTDLPLWALYPEFIYLKGRDDMGATHGGSQRSCKAAVRWGKQMLGMSLQEKKNSYSDQHFETDRGDGTLKAGEQALQTWN